MSFETPAPLGAPTPSRQTSLSEGIQAKASLNSADAAAPEVKAKDTSTERMALLARKERAMQARAREIAAREQALRTKETELQSPKFVERDSFKKELAEKLKSDPWGFFEELDTNYDNLTQSILNSPIRPEDHAYRKLQNEIAQLKKAQVDQQESQQKLQQQSYDNAIKQLKVDVESLVSTDQTFEMIKNTKSEDAVVELIREIYEQEGKLLSIEEAAEAVEEHLLEDALKIAQLDKVKKKLTPAEIVEQASEASVNNGAKMPEHMKWKGSPITVQPRSSAMTTLTNAMTATSSAPSSGPRTEADRIRRAMAAFKGGPAT